MLSLHDTEQRWTARPVSVFKGHAVVKRDFTTHRGKRLPLQRQMFRAETDRLVHTSMSSETLSGVRTLQKTWAEQADTALFFPLQGVRNDHSTE